MNAPRVARALLAALGTALAGEAGAQQTVRELMDAGGRMAAPAELRALLGAASTAGPAAGGATGGGAAGGASSAARVDE
ncbi:MAG: hypothetical protein WCK28_20245, partial [Burkholderiales bacterium]